MTLINRIIQAPAPLGSYKNEDVVFLLKDLSDIPLEKGNEVREEAIQSGTHYSEMLPVEYQPTEEYIQLFHSTLAASAKKVAAAAAVTAELIVRKRGFNTMIASLARAGTPIGILIKRYIKMVYNHDLPHYSISIIRGRGIDENALLFMLQNHSGLDIQFVDGWTGKGAIRNVLIEACNLFEDKYGITLSDDLAVLADPGCCSTTFGTREDFLIPSACLNSTVSGLMSRTVLHKDLIGPNEFHGAKYYKEWLPNDVSNLFVDHISNQFKNVIAQAKAEADSLIRNPSHNIATWQGMKDIRRIQEEFGIENVDLVKPGIGETTRVLLRRVPWRILVNRLDNHNLKHILLLAKERNVPVEMYPELTYSCCGIIKPLKVGEQV